MNTQSLIKNYYLKKGYSLKTIEDYLVNWKIYTEWLSKQPILINYKNVKHADMLAFQKYVFQVKKKQGIVNYVLRCIKCVYKALIAANRLKYNPADMLHVRGILKPAVPPLFKKEELESIYHNHLENTGVNIRRKVILGLMVFQGLDVATIEKLGIEDIDMERGIIHIPALKKTNGRVLKLDFKQFVVLNKYLSEIQFRITNKQLVTNKLIQKTDKYKKLNNIVCKLFEQLKKVEPRVINSLHIRRSVIHNWCREYPNNLPMVQYLAGHKYISSTESYMDNDIMDLAMKVNKYFPINFSK